MQSACGLTKRCLQHPEATVRPDDQELLEQYLLVLVILPFYFHDALYSLKLERISSC
jgi:hypothetical protein